MEQTLLASAARTATGQTGDIGNQHRGATFFLNITAVSGTSPSMTVKLQAKDPASGQYVDIPGATFAAKTATGADTLIVYPGVVETANRASSRILPATYRAVYTLTGTNPSFTFSLAASYAP